MNIIDMIVPDMAQALYKAPWFLVKVEFFAVALFAMVLNNTETYALRRRWEAHNNMRLLVTTVVAFTVIAVVPFVAYRAYVYDFNASQAAYVPSWIDRTLEGARKFLGRPPGELPKPMEIWPFYYTFWGVALLGHLVGERLRFLVEALLGLLDTTLWLAGFLRNRLRRQNKA